MGAYILSLMVTLDQELAIQTLFTQKSWQFIRIDQTSSAGGCSISGTFTLVGKNDKTTASVKSKELPEPTAESKGLPNPTEKSNDLPDPQPNVSSVVDNNEDEPPSVRIESMDTSVDDLNALGITVKEEVQSGGEDVVEEDLFDDDYDTDNYVADTSCVGNTSNVAEKDNLDQTSTVGDTSNVGKKSKTSQVNKSRKRKKKSKALTVKKRKPALGSEVKQTKSGPVKNNKVKKTKPGPIHDNPTKPTVKVEIDYSVPEEDANLLALLEELPDIKHISELVTSKCSESDSDLPSGTLPNVDTDANSYVSSLAVYYCKWCHYTFPELTHFKGHKRKGQCFFVCQFCKEKFTFRNFTKYQDHLKEHRVAGDRKKIRQLCKVCGKTFSKRSSLSDHERRHGSQATFQCCGYKFFSRSHLFRHQKHLCNRCGKTYGSQKALNVHERKHYGAVPFSCCGKQFSDKTQYTRHRCNYHDEEKAYPCAICGKRFGTRSDMTRHEKRVHEEKNFFCDFCTQSYTYQSQLDEHYSCHSGDKKYICHCGKPFVYSSGLARHRRLCIV